MSRSRLKLAVARHPLALALNRPIPLAANVNAIEPRHLLRALLRQSRYLPDAKARDHFYNHIVDRYRKYHPRPPKPPNVPTLTLIRRRSLLKEARKGLVFLKRANDGHPNHLLRVLAMAYGRTGRKRHELMKMVVSSSSFKSDPSPVDEQALTQLSASITASLRDSHVEERPAKSHRPKLLSGLEGPVLGPRLEALVNSQKQQRASHFSKLKMINTLPSIPETNSWGRPMPRRRIVNMKYRWYANILEKVLPPLPESDWNRLRDLALGQAPWEGPMKRRTPLTQTKVKGPSRNGNQPVNINEITPHFGASSVLENNEIFKEENRKLLGSNPHTLTPRFMRRLWGQVFLQCPMMKWDAERCRWDVKWGSLQRSKEVILGQPGRINMDIFRGVDEKGNVVPSRRAR